MNEIQQTPEEKHKVRKAIKTQFSASIIAALGLVAGLAWNDAVQSTIAAVFPVSKGLLPKFIYAIAITLLIAIVAYLVSKWLSSDEKK